MSSLTELPPGLPVPQDDGAAAHLLGLPAPRVSLPSSSGTPVRLDELGAGRTVLFVYPMTGRSDLALPDGWDEIPGARGCTSEACDFSDHHGDLLDAGAARLFGVAARDLDYQKEAADRLRLPYPLLADAGRELAVEPGLPTFQAGDLTLYKRLTLVLRDDVIEHVFYPIFPPNRHAGEVVRWLRANPVDAG